MKILDVLLFEWKHFIRSPFKIFALILFIAAGIYGLHVGADLFNEQSDEIEKVEQLVSEERGKYLEMYEKDSLIPEDKTWINLGTPLYAIEYSFIYHNKKPSPAMVYSIGQGEQYGYSKKITRWSSPYDSDLVEEIANPERLQTGSLDFAFALLFLSPLLLLVLLYNLKSLETEQGFLPLIEVQSTSENIWLISRMLFYVIIVLLSLVFLIVYGGRLTSVVSDGDGAFGQMFLYSTAYIIFWSILYFFILKTGKSIMGNSLKMIGLYLVFVFIIPATVSQVLSIKYPTNLMVDFADAKLEKRWDVWGQPSEERQEQLSEMFPEIVNSPISNDESRIDMAIRASTSALENQLQIESIQPIEEANKSRNDFIKSTYIINPVTFFQNKFNSIAGTHYDDYQNYRSEIQFLVDKQIEILIVDMWMDKEVDGKKYEEYIETLSRVN